MMEASDYMREHGLRRGEWMYLKVLEVDCRD
jgi:hypothetical protein